MTSLFPGSVALCEESVLAFQPNRPPHSWQSSSALHHTSQRLGLKEFLYCKMEMYSAGQQLLRGPVPFLCHGGDLHKAAYDVLRMSDIAQL